MEDHRVQTRRHGYGRARWRGAATNPPVASTPVETSAGSVLFFSGTLIHPPFMGQLAGRHPEKSLATGYVNSLEADDEEITRRSRES